MSRLRLDNQWLDGPQRAALRECLVNAFDAISFAQMLFDRLSQRLDLLVPAKDLTFEQIVDRTIQKADEQSWSAELLAAAQAERPDDLGLAQFAERLASSPTPPNPASAPPMPPPGAQTIIHGDVIIANVSGSTNVVIGKGTTQTVGAPPAPGTTVAAPAPSAPDLRALELAYLDKLLADYAYWAQRYTPLAGITTIEIKTDTPTLDLPDMFMPTGFEKLVEQGFGPERRIERVRRDDLRAAVAEYKRLVVLGEPGSGKTTTLQRLVYDFAVAAKADPTAPLPILVPLGGYSGPEQPLDFVAQYGGELGTQLSKYLHSGRMVLLLDALNEMPRADYAERVGKIQKLLDDYEAAPVVVTCRALDYVPALNLERLEVKPLDPLRQREFLQRYLGESQGEQLFWALAGNDVTRLWSVWQRTGGKLIEFWTANAMPEQANFSRTQADLWRSLRAGYLPPLLALGVNPYLLVMMAQVYKAGRGTLPQNRGKLFGAFVATLLERERKRRAQEPWPGVDVISRGLAKLAFAMQQAGERGTAVEHAWAMEQLTIAGCDATEVLYLGASASLLEMTDHQVRFVHQLIQEYLAALAWEEKVAAGEDLHAYWPDGWLTPTGWEETAILLAGILPEMTPFIKALKPVNPPLAARCIAESGGVRPGDGTMAAVQAALVSFATSLTAPVPERNAAGDALNILSDPRAGVGVRADGLPDILWCEVPAGPFIMGNTKQTDELAWDDEAPQHRPALTAFAISQYPITNAQFAVFVQDGGYAEQWRRCWTAAGWTWKESNNRMGPLYIGGAYDLPNHPVVGVSWYEAMAFCGWLCVKLGQPIVLPTEAQWEKAARGTDGRRYPWGGGLTPEHANYAKTGIGTTSAVGIFSRGASPYGALDMAGNVWEWTTTKWADSYQGYKPDDSPEGYERRVVRGGAFDDDPQFVRCAARYGFNPGYDFRDRGFRVVLSPSSTSGL